MKSYYLCLFLLPLFISCSNSSDSVSLDSTNDVVHRYDQLIDTIPINNANPYDLAGQIHNELLFSYYYENTLPLTLTGIINTSTSIANTTPSFIQLIQARPYLFNASGRVAYIISHLDSCQSEIINASLETESGKTSLRNFIRSLLSLCETEDDFAVIYKYVIAYEDGVLNDKMLTDKDKKVILTTTSIARHSAYARKKKPKKNNDPEWLLMVGNIMAATEGATESTEEAVMRSLITGIVENN